ncbi:MAG: tetratricopeptide repeat protein [Planctomycetota bacterium]
MSSAVFHVVGPISFAWFVLQSVVSIAVFWRILADKPVSGLWTERNAAWTLLFTGIYSSAVGTIWFTIHVVEWTGTSGGYDLGAAGAIAMALFLCAGLAFWNFLIPIYVFGEGSSLWLVMPGYKNIRLRRECEKAKTAEMREDFALAEELYKAELTGKPRDDDAVYLSLGSLYQRLGRTAEAVEAWQKALEGDLASETQIVTVLRLSDALSQKLGRHEEAAAILEKILRHFPHEPDAKVLQERLEDLKKEQSSRA